MGMRCGCLICPKTFGTVRCVHCVKSAENKTEKPPDCSSDGFVLVGDERIELPQVESESTALPLCKSPIIWFVSCGVSRSTCAIIPANAVLVKPVFEKVVLFGNQRSSAKVSCAQTTTPPTEGQKSPVRGRGCVYSGLLPQKAARAVSSAAGPGRYCRCFQWSGNSR